MKPVQKPKPISGTGRSNMPQHIRADEFNYTIPMQIWIPPEFRAKEDTVPNPPAEKKYWIHYYGDLTVQDEWEAMDRYFNVSHDLRLIPPGSVVVPRYTIHPQNRELYLGYLNSNWTSTVNLTSHQAASNIREWYPRLTQTLTPQTWFEPFAKPPGLPQLSRFVVRGSEKSKKENWREEMFCPDFHRANQKMKEDSDNVIRAYHDLKSYGTHDCGIPISREFRIFVFNGKFQYGNFYWAPYADQFNVPQYDRLLPMSDRSFLATLNQAIERFGEAPHWVTYDMAQLASGGWVVIEMNDAHRAGVPVFNPEKDYDIFYKNLHDCVDRDYKNVKNSSTSDGGTA